ncbi:DMT family transporter [Pararobbsia silviterrae]|nr:DMT family transporter [Pararobbsia silviterrae]
MLFASSTSSAVALGLASAAFYGVADALAGTAARAIGVRRAVFSYQVLGLCVVVAYLGWCVFSGRLTGLPGAPALSWAVALAGAFATLGGSVSFSRALSLGNAGVVAPIMTCYGAITTVLSVLTGEVLGVLQILGLAICMIGVPLIASAGDASEPAVRAHARQAVGWALVSAMLYGVGFWLEGRFVLPVLGTLPLLVISYMVGTTVLGASLARRGDDPRMRAAPRWAWLLTLCCGLLGLAGLTSIAAGAQTGALSIVTVLSTLSAVVTTIIGLMRGERMTPWQWSGLAAVMVGVGMLRMA